MFDSSPLVWNIFLLLFRRPKISRQAVNESGERWERIERDLVDFVFAFFFLLLSCSVCCRCVYMCSSRPVSLTLLYFGVYEEKPSGAFLIFSSFFVSIKLYNPERQRRRIEREWEKVKKIFHGCMLARDITSSRGTHKISLTRSFDKFRRTFLLLRCNFWVWEEYKKSIEKT